MASRATGSDKGISALPRLAGGAGLGGAMAPRGAVEQRVDETMTVTAAVAAAQVYGLVDDHAPGYFRAVHQLVQANQQDGMLDRIELRHGPVGKIREFRVQRLAALSGLQHQFLEERLVRRGRHALGQELKQHVLGALAAQLPLVQGLQRQLARGAAPAARLGGDGRVHVQASSRAISRAISMADMAASAPLLPALVPARSSACSMVSVVSTPKATGTPWRSPAAAMPFTHWPAT